MPSATRRALLVGGMALLGLAAAPTKSRADASLPVAAPPPPRPLVVVESFETAQLVLYGDGRLIFRRGNDRSPFSTVKLRPEEVRSFVRRASRCRRVVADKTAPSEFGRCEDCGPSAVLTVDEKRTEFWPRRPFDDGIETAPACLRALLAFTSPTATVWRPPCFELVVLRDAMKGWARGWPPVRFDSYPPDPGMVTLPGSEYEAALAFVAEHMGRAHTRVPIRDDGTIDCKARAATGK